MSARIEAGTTLDLPDEDRVDASSDRLAPGAMIGRFVVRARLGEGGMGVVYAADDPDVGRPVALKLVRPDVDGPMLRARLLREAQAMGQLDHPHVVRVHEVGSAGDRLFVAMELIEGVTLARWLAAAPRGWPDVLRLFRQAGEGLAAAHRAGLVHRDFKPDNVLVDAAERARVADFGLVRVRPGSPPVSPGLAAQLTRTGAMMGTPGYMAPEQQLGGDVDARADQYAFCVALREALGDARPVAPAAVRAIALRGLAFEPRARFASMDELLVALDRSARAPRRRRLAIGAGVVALLVAGSAAAVVLASDAPPVTPAAAVAARVDVDAGAGAGLDAGAPLAAAPDAAVIPPPATRAAAPAAPAPSARSRPATPPPTPAGGAAKAGPGSGSVELADGTLIEADGTVLRPPIPFVASGSKYPSPPPPPTLHAIDQAHLPAVRVALHDLGYRGVAVADLDADRAAAEQRARATRDQLVADGGTDLVGIATANLALGQLRRRGGDCAGAEPLLREAIRGFAQAEVVEARDLDATLRLGRAHLGRGLCRLAAGDATGARKELDSGIRLIGWGHGGDVERAECQLALGILTYEQGDPRGARGWLQPSGRRGDDRVRRALEGWEQAVGFDAFAEDP